MRRVRRRRYCLLRYRLLTPDATVSQESQLQQLQEEEAAEKGEAASSGAASADAVVAHLKEAGPPSPSR